MLIKNLSCIVLIMFCYCLHNHVWPQWPWYVDEVNSR